MTRTIQEVINLIVASVPGAPLPASVDVFKTGDPSQEVTGIITTFTATMSVLQRAVALGANLVITHEPTFYEHHDATDWLEHDPVYQAKRAFIEQHNLTIWRFHDYWHMHEPDGIGTGMLNVLGWQHYRQTEPSALLLMPDLPLSQLLATLKEKLHLPVVRVVGDPDHRCTRLGLLVGAIGGTNQIRFFREWNLDTVICGETEEWKTCEYVRDSNAFGQPKALLIIGHASSEEEGMHYLVEWLQPKIPEVSITYIPVGDPVTLL